MAKARFVVPVDILKEIHGKIVARDAEGHRIKGVEVRYMKASGKHYLCCTGKRDLEKCPYSEKELAAKARFAEAQSKVKAVLEDEAKKAEAMVAFEEARKRGTTKAVTLRGWLLAINIRRERLAN